MIYKWYFHTHMLVIIKKEENGSRIGVDGKYSMKDSV